MKYYCDHCSYKTDKKANYIRHLNRKFKCYKYEKKVDVNYKKVDVDYKKVDVDYKKVDVDYKKVDVGDKTVLTSDKFNCHECNRLFSTKHALAYHTSICNGLSKLQCEICCKIFTSKYGKYQHKRHVLCFPPVPLTSPPHTLEDQRSENALTVHETTFPTSISNIQNKTNNQTIILNNNNTINNIIQYNAFGDEGIDQLVEFLGEDKEIIERLKQVGKKQLYGIRDIQNDIFFNPKNPKGFSIIKPEKYGSSVRVRNNEGEFEYMEFEDVRDPMLNYMEKYIEIYNKTRNKYNIKFRDPKERRIVHTFLKILNDDLDIYLNNDLKDDLDIEEESNECENDDEDMKYKQFDKLSLDNIHVQTKKYFKCKKGEFLLNDNNV